MLRPRNRLVKGALFDHKDLIGVFLDVRLMLVVSCGVAVLGFSVLE